MSWTWHFVLSEPEPGWQGSVGELTIDVLKACVGEDDAGTHYFVCGPAAMMDSVLGSLRDLGIPEERAITERLDLAAAKGPAQSSNTRLLHIGVAIILAIAALAFALR